MILYATLTEFRTVGPFELNWETQQYKCWISQYITFALLATLQSINLLWLFFILRIAYNIAFAKVIHDVRSDDEASEDERDGDRGQNGTAEARHKRTNGRISNGNALEPSAESVVERRRERRS